MAKPKKSIQWKKRNETVEPFLQIDKRRVPLNEATAFVKNSIKAKYPLEYDVINRLNVNASATFPRDKLNVVTAIKTYLHKSSKKVFIMKKVDATTGRIWRAANGTIVRKGGRAVGGPYRKEEPEETK